MLLVSFLKGGNVMANKNKFKLIKVILVALIIIVCATLYFKNFSNNKGLRVIEWDNIYNDNNITLFYQDIEEKPNSIKKLDNVYSVSKIVNNNKSELEKALQTVDILKSIIEYDDVDSSVAKDGYGILDEKGGNKKVSDRDMAIIERDILLAAGFVARVGEFRKETPQFQKNPSYYVVEYWSKEDNKWIMVDFKDKGYLEKGGVKLSSIEVLGEKLKDLTYIGNSSQNDYRKKISKYLSSYTVAIDNTISMKKSNSYLTYCSSEKDIDMKIENDYFPSTIFTTEKTLFTLSPSTKANGKDSSTYIILMRKPMESSNSYVYVIGAFENGSTIKDYYLRINDGEMKKIDRYEEVELVEGTNKIELSKDGVNILKRIVVERDK